MCPAAAVVVPIAIAAAGTAASISAQNKQAATQNAAIDAQISSNKRQEEIRQAANSYQMKIVNQTSRLERIARQAEFRAKQQEADLTVRQTEFATEAAKIGAETDMVKGNTAATQQGRGLDQQQYEIDKARLANRNQLREQEVALQSGVSGVYGQTAQSIGQAAERAKEVSSNLQKLSKDTSSMRAQMYAMGMGKGASADVLTAQKSVVEDALSQLQTTREVAAGAEQNIQDAKAAADSNRKVMALNYGLQENELSNAVNLAAGQRSMLARYQSYLGQQAASTMTGADMSLANVKRQVELTKKSNKLNLKLANNQARMDKTLTQAGMVTGYQLSAANAASQRAALAAQRVSGPSGGEQFASIAQTLTPLLKLYGGQSTTPSVQPYQGYQTAAVNNFGINNNVPNLGGTISRYPSTITQYPPLSSSSSLDTYKVNPNIKF